MDPTFVQGKDLGCNWHSGQLRCAGKDHFDAFLESSADSASQMEQRFLDCLDAAVEWLSHCLLRSAAAVSAGKVDLDISGHRHCVRLVARLLAVRHAYLDHHVYQARLKAQQDAVATCKVFFLAP